MHARIVEAPRRITNRGRTDLIYWRCAFWDTEADFLSNRDPKLEQDWITNTLDLNKKEPIRNAQGWNKRLSTGEFVDPALYNPLDDLDQYIEMKENNPVSFRLNKSPGPYVLSVAPLHGTLSGTAPNLTYTPDTDYFGNDVFSYLVRGTLWEVTVNIMPIFEYQTISIKDQVIRKVKRYMAKAIINGDEGDNTSRSGERGEFRKNGKVIRPATKVRLPVETDDQDDPKGIVRRPEVLALQGVRFDHT